MYGIVAHRYMNTSSKQIKKDTKIFLDAFRWYYILPVNELLYLRIFVIASVFQ